MDPDAELHAAIIAGEQAAVAEFDQRYREQFMSRGVRKGMPLADAEDAWQEVFIGTIQRARSLTGPLGQSLRQYASKAMGNRIADYHRSRERELRVDLSVDELAPTDAPAHSHADERVRAEVRRCLERVGDTHRVILEALFTEQLTPEALADTLGVPRNTVYQKKIRALARIRPCLEEALRAN